MAKCLNLDYLTGNPITAYNDTIHTTLPTNFSSSVLSSVSSWILFSLTPSLLPCCPERTVVVEPVRDHIRLLSLVVEAYDTANLCDISRAISTSNQWRFTFWAEDTNLSGGGGCQSGCRYWVQGRIIAVRPWFLNLLPIIYFSTSEWFMYVSEWRISIPYAV